MRVVASHFAGQQVQKHEVLHVLHLLPQGLRPVELCECRRRCGSSQVQGRDQAESVRRVRDHMDVHFAELEPTYQNAPVQVQHEDSRGTNPCGQIQGLQGGRPAQESQVHSRQHEHL